MVFWGRLPRRGYQDYEYSCTAADWLVEEWPFLDDRELDSFRGHRSCATCDHFGYVTLGQCQVLGSCHLRQGLLAPGAHSLKSCEHWVFCSEVDPY